MFATGLCRADDKVVQTFDGTTAQTLRNSLEKHFDIEGITKPETREIDIHRENDHWVAIADYEDLAPLFGNVSLLVQFHKEAEVR